jgi:hypothetical protein
MRHEPAAEGHHPDFIDQRANLDDESLYLVHQ